MKQIKLFTALELVLLLIFSAPLPQGLAQEVLPAQEMDYYYALTYNKTESTNTACVLDLMMIAKAGAEIPITGVFGLQFPQKYNDKLLFSLAANEATEDVTDTNCDYACFVPEELSAKLQYSAILGAGTMVKGANYFVFAWKRNDKAEVTGKVLEDGTMVQILPVAKFKFSVPVSELTKTTFSQFNWMDAEVAQLPEMNYRDPMDPYNGSLNDEIWQAQTDVQSKISGYYQAAYLANENAEIRIGSVGFQLSPDPAWPDAEGVTVCGTVYAYDPKKPIVVTLYQWDEAMKGGEGDYEQIPTVEPFCPPVWDGEIGDNEYYKGNAEGTGLYKHSFEFLNVPEGRYKAVVQKKGHLDFTVAQIQVGAPGTAEVLLPEIWPSCGDINQDGKIKLQDRNILLAYLNRVKDSALPENQSQFVLADLNGDGKVTLADLNILMAPRNYNRVPASIDMPEEPETKTGRSIQP